MGTEEVVSTKGLGQNENLNDDNWKGIGKRPAPTTNIGRFPANVLHDGSAEVVGMFPETTSQENSIPPQKYVPNGKNAIYGDNMGGGYHAGFGDSGSAARFFWSPKAGQEERPEWIKEDGKRVRHPTVKPLELMRYLVKLVTPPGGTIVEPFAGSGATVEAAWLGHWPCDAIDLEADHLPLIQARLRERVADLPLFEKPEEPGSGPVQRSFLD